MCGQEHIVQSQRDPSELPLSVDVLWRCPLHFHASCVSAGAAHGTLSWQRAPTGMAGAAS